MQLNFTEYNNKVNDWAVRAGIKMQQTARSMAVQHRSNSPSPEPSVPKIAGRARISDDIAIGARIGFPRALIWTSKGAGRGQGGTKGSRWMDANGNRKKTNPDSIGRMGTGTRHTKPWFNRVLSGPDGVEQLATIAAGELGTAIIKSPKI